MVLVKNIIKNLKDITPYTFKIFYKKNFRKFYGLKNIDEKMLKYMNYNLALSERSKLSRVRFTRPSNVLICQF